MAKIVKNWSKKAKNMSCCRHLVVAIMIFGTTLTSCEKSGFTVSFNSNGGSKVPSQKVMEGEKVIKPDDPTHDEYAFVAWYKEKELANEWDFDTDVVTSNMTLYAKWGDIIQWFSDIPAIVDYDNEVSLPIIKTAYGVLIAPELQNSISSEQLLKGSTILTSFTVNFSQQLTAKYPTATEMEWLKVDVGFPSATIGGESETGDFNIPIENMVVIGLVDYFLFFAFQHTAPKDQKFIYEMTYEPNENIPVLLIRAKKDITEGSVAVGTVNYPYAFNMFDFFMSHKDSENMVRFNIMYKTGVNNLGNEIFKPYGDRGFIVSFD